MLNLLNKFKLFLPKAWVWIKAHWYIPAVLVYTLLCFLFFRKNADAALKLLASQKTSYEAQIKTINETNAKNLAEKEKALEEYKKLMLDLKSKYNVLEKDLSKAKQERIKELLKEDNKDFAKNLASEMGWTYDKSMENLRGK